MPDLGCDICFDCYICMHHDAVDGLIDPDPGTMQHHVVPGKRLCRQNLHYFCGFVRGVSLFFPSCGMVACGIVRIPLCGSIWTVLRR